MENITNASVISADVSGINTIGNTIPFILCLADWESGETSISVGCYRGNDTKQIPKIIVYDNIVNSVVCDGNTLEVHYNKTSYATLYY